MLKKASFFIIGIAFAVLLLANLFITYVADDETVDLPLTRDGTTYRHTSHGDIVGFIDRHGARSWQGVPYASPPTKDLRWRAPRPPQNSYELRETLIPSDSCPQFALAAEISDESAKRRLIGKEDCLYLNVWSPPNAVDLPVMVWVHGGGNTIGNGGSYNGAWLAANREVVVVTINYRLGVFGWFRHPAIRTGNHEDDSGNFGTLDIIQSLKWVNENILEFGGDPNNVTIFGESAGGLNVLAMIVSPLAKGLFHKAIVQSGGISLTTTKRAEQSIIDGGHPFSGKEIVSKLLVADDLVDNHESSYNYQNRVSANQLSEYLYNKTPSEIYRILEAGNLGMIQVPDIFRDGHVIPDLSTAELLSSREQHNMVPIILGTNRDEPSLFMFRDSRYIENYFGLFPRIKNEHSYKQAVRYGGLSWKVRGVDDIAVKMSSAGNSNVFAYRFDWDEEPSQYGFDLSLALGAAHALEIPFVFGDFTDGLFSIYGLYPNDEPQNRLSESITSYWTQFAYTGSPGRGRDNRESHWTSWKEAGNTSLILDTERDSGIRMISDQYTMQGIKKEFLEDIFTSEKQKCELYKSTFRGDHFVQSEYVSLTASGCN